MTDLYNPIFEIKYLRSQNNSWVFIKTKSKSSGLGGIMNEMLRYKIEMFKNELT